MSRGCLGLLVLLSSNFLFDGVHRLLSSFGRCVYGFVPKVSWGFTGLQEGVMTSHKVPARVS